MPPIKDEKDCSSSIITTDSLKSSIKHKTNKVSDIKRTVENSNFNGLPVDQSNVAEAHERPTEMPKKVKKIKFSNEVLVKDLSSQRYFTSKLCDNKDTNKCEYTINDIDDAKNEIYENILETNSSDEKPMGKTTRNKKTKTVQLPRERVIDMSPEDQKQWELEEMLKPIDLERAQVHIDPSPFQLVERTSILKVHSLFSMVGINHAYVTKIGRLVGVVGLKELRKAIEDINSNSFVVPPRDEELDIKPAVEKPLLSPSASDKAVDMTVTSMDSALSNSDNCSDIEMEHLKALEANKTTDSKPNLNSTTDTNTEVGKTI